MDTKTDITIEVTWKDSKLFHDKVEKSLHIKGKSPEFIVQYYKQFTIGTL
jgi:hypothetical protein